MCKSGKKHKRQKGEKPRSSRPASLQHRRWVWLNLEGYFSLFGVRRRKPPSTLGASSRGLLSLSSAVI